MLRLTTGSMKKLAMVGALSASVMGCELSLVKDKPNPFKRAGWDISQTRLNCSDSSRCPNGVGVMFTLGGNTVWRCTASLYEPTKLVTAAHCTEHIRPGTTSYFRTPSTSFKPSQVFRIKGVLKEVFPGSGRGVDYASVELAEPALGYNYVTGPSALDSGLKSLTAVVVNSGRGEDYILDAVDCEFEPSVSRGYRLSDFPNMFGTQSCRLVSGNSGGPVFSKADTAFRELLGVLSRSTEANGARTRGRGLNLATVIHAGCFELPGWPSPSPSCKDMGDEVSGVEMF